MKILDRIDQGLPPVVYGDGSQSYDFIYVSDVARANKEHRQYAGFSASPVGLQYSVVNPVSYEGKHIGVLQFGLRDSLLIDAIHAKLEANEKAAEDLATASREGIKDK